MNPGSEWLEWQNPWWLLLVIPLLAGLFWRSRTHYLKKAHSSFAPLYIGFGGELKRIATRFRFAFPSVLKFLALLAIITALVDITRAYVFVEELLAMHRFPVLIDNSSSMYGFSWGRRHDSITCNTSGRFYPRINGACRALYRLLDEVEVHTKKKVGQSQDLIGLIQFASRSYVTSYLTNDYAGLREKIDRMEFNSEVILGVQTEMHLGIWDMYLMALDRNLRGDAGFTHLTGQDLRDLVKSLAPGDPSSPFTIPKELEKKLLKIREEMRDAVFIVITDAVVSYLVPRVESATPFSIRRQMQLAAFLELPVYFLSTDEFYPELKKLARQTGFGPPDGKHRGDFLMVKKDKDYYDIEALVANILESRFSLTLKNPVERRESYADYALILALIFWVTAIVWNQLFSPSLTDY